jgi:hypothetical protein
MPYARITGAPTTTSARVPHRGRDDRDDQRHHQPELPGVDEHRHQRQGRLEGVDHQHQSGELHEAADLIDVGGDPRDQRTTVLRRLVQHRQVVDVAEGLDAEPRERRLAHVGETDVHESGAAGGDRHRHQSDHRHLDDKRQVDLAGDESTVQHLLDGDRDDDPSGGGHQPQ